MITISFCNNYRLLVTSDNEQTIRNLIVQFRTVDYGKYLIKKYGRKELKTYSKTVELCTKIDNFTLSLNAGFLDYLLAAIEEQEIFFGKIPVEYKNFHSLPPIQLKERWLDILYDQQKSLLATLLSFSGGILHAKTGFGKSECILAIVDSIDETETCLINVPNNAIRDELIVRGREKYGIVLGYGDPTKKVNIVNPTAFLRSNLSENKDFEEWLNRVTLVITDEVQHLSSNSMKLLFERLPNVLRSYGVSATPTNLSTGLTPEETPIANMGSSIAQVIGLSGPVRARCKPNTKMKLLKVKTKISDEKAVRNLTTWSECLDHMLTHERLAKVLKSIFLSFEKKIFYIPIHKKESALALHDRLMSFGVSGVYWESGAIYPTALHTEPTHLESIKKLVREGKVQYVMSTSVSFEGVDFPKLDGFIPLIGVNKKVVLQTAGRSSRGDSLLTILIFDAQNKLVLSQMRKRQTILVGEYDIVYENSLSIDSSSILNYQPLISDI